MLDAYTDSGPSTPVVKDDHKPVTKKNKNQRKRAEKMRQASESETKPESTEVIDSWEDLETNTDEINVPRSIEFPVKKPVEVQQHEEPPKEKVSIQQKTDNVLTEKMSKLQLTMSNIETTFQQNISNKKTVVEKTTESKDQKPTTAATDKTPEEIKAEREAKKKAKAAAKEAAKSKGSNDTGTVISEQKIDGKSTSTETKAEEKTPEEIKAEREAKKKAKAAAKEAAKNKTKDSPKDVSNTTVSENKKESSQKEKPSENKDVSTEKSKAELKAERRAKQEEQRAKKAAEAQKKVESSKPKVVKRVPDEIQADRACVEKKLVKKLASQQILPRTQAQRKVMLFSHLHQYEREFSLSRSYPVVGSHIHPSIMTLGKQPV